ncbi:MAG: NAD(P)/FAD-dependent oxidoreductase [Bacteroidota bacterium]
MVKEVVIIGAGLSGLTTAYELKKKGIKDVLIVEASNRIGGRMQSTQIGQNGYLEMGATWLGEKHTYLNELLKELNVGIFEQYRQGKSCYQFGPSYPLQHFIVPEEEPPHFRIQNGSESLIQRLYESSGVEVKLNTKVVSVKDEQSHVALHFEDGSTLDAVLVINTIPPKLTLHAIDFSPALGEALQNAMDTTHTWMSNALKFAVVYEHPFWKEKGFSGMAMSQSGPVQELHDHTNYQENFFALKGFFSSDVARVTKPEQREEIIVDWIAALMGEEAKKYVTYQEKDWFVEPLTSTQDSNHPQFHPQYGHPLFQAPLMEGKFWFSGTETAEWYGGYMEGAVYAGLTAAKRILHSVAAQKDN